MKKLSVIALTLVASTVVLSGCGEKKIEPNNYHCTYDREELESLSRQGKIDDVTKYIKECRVKKLGQYNPEMIKLKDRNCGLELFDKKITEAEYKKCEHAPQDLIEKWKKEAEQM